MSHQKWWPELFKNAFLAPVFIFFFYLIVLFLDILKDLTYNDSDPLFGKLMGVVIPFAILFVLLMKAKELAVEYSGEMGKGITKSRSSAWWSSSRRGDGWSGDGSKRDCRSCCC